LNKYLIQPVKLATAGNAYIKIIHRDLKREVTDIVYDGELQIKKMKMNKIEEITNAYDSWTTYKEKIDSEKSS